MQRFEALQKKKIDLNGLEESVKANEDMTIDLF